MTDTFTFLEYAKEEASRMWVGKHRERSIAMAERFADFEDFEDRPINSPANSLPLTGKATSISDPDERLRRSDLIASYYILPIHAKHQKIQKTNATILQHH